MRVFIAALMLGAVLVINTVLAGGSVDSVHPPQDTSRASDVRD